MNVNWSNALKSEVIVALIAGLVAVIGALITILGQVRITKLAHGLTRMRQLESEDANISKITAMYNDPLLSSALDLQRRLFSISEHGFLRQKFQDRQVDKEHAIRSTLYRIAEYLGWCEILRSEIQFVGWGKKERNRILRQKLEGVTQAFIHGGHNIPLYIPRTVQRAIGEIMITIRQYPDAERSQCIGYAQFIKQLKNPEFAIWFENLNNDIEKIATKDDSDKSRLMSLQKTVMSLIEFLDPDGIRWPKEQWIYPV